MKVLQWSLAVIYVIFGLLQLNDPDPEIWGTWYFCLALLCMMDARGRMSRWVWLLPLLIAVVWVMRIWPESWEGFAFKEGMHNDNIEQAREAGGLIICAIFSAIFFKFRSKP
jgi:hypothetical protein